MYEHASQPGDQDQGSAEQGYSAVADRIQENMAIAALRVGDATQDLVSLIKSLVAAGKELESALAIQRELGAASLKAVEQAREAADAASSSAREASEARSQSSELLGRMDHEYGTVSGLVQDLRDRIAALSILGSPLPARDKDHELDAEQQPEPESSVESDGSSPSEDGSGEQHDEAAREDDYDAELRAAS
jgi:hypothetical protein